MKYTKKLCLNQNSYRYLFVILIIIGINSNSFSQECSTFKYIYIDSTTTLQSNIDTSDNSKSCCDSVLIQLKDKFISKGYLGFSIDSITYNSDVCDVYIFKGFKYRLKETQVFPKYFFESGSYYILKPILNYKSIEKIDYKVLQNARDKGYPYATLSKRVVFDKNRATFIYTVKPDKKVLFDTIRTSPPGLISYTYLSKRTNIEANSIFKASAIEKINRNINQDRLFKLDSVYTKIVDNKAMVTLKLKRFNQNSFSGLVGLQSVNDEASQITGNISISLVNALKKGENIKLDWQKSDSESQQLETTLKLPYIFKLPIGVLFYGNFDKQDTLFTNTNIKAGILIPTINYGELSVNGKWINSSAGGSDNLLINSTKGVLYGLGYSYSHIDNPILIKKGISISSEVYLGSNTLLNAEINNYKNMLFEWICSSELVLPLPIGGLNIRNRTALTLSDSLKLNNLYRTGGVKAIRGFNERSIYARAYTFANTEYHLYINSLSYIYMLYDIGIFNEPSENTYTNNIRQSVGVGFSVNTSAGRLAISYALGKKGGESIFKNRGQVHIGYINLF